MKNMNKFNGFTPTFELHKADNHLKFNIRVFNEIGGWIRSYHPKETHKTLYEFLEYYGLQNYQF